MFERIVDGGMTLAQAAADAEVREGTAVGYFSDMVHNGYASQSTGCCVSLPLAAVLTWLHCHCLHLLQAPCYSRCVGPPRAHHGQGCSCQRVCAAAKQAHWRTSVGHAPKADKDRH